MTPTLSLRLQMSCPLNNISLASPDMGAEISGKFAIDKAHAAGTAVRPYKSIKTLGFHIPQMCQYLGLTPSRMLLVSVNISIIIFYY